MNAWLRLFAAPVLLAAVGCAAFRAGAAEDYDLGNAPPKQFANDAAVCAKLAEADQRNFGIAGDMDPTHATYNRMFDSCMRASGYRRKPEP
jgi:hypothetical protein